MNKYLFILFIITSCSYHEINKIENLKKKEKLLEEELDSLYTRYQDIKYASGLSVKDTLLYNKDSEKYINRQNSELYFYKFFTQAFVNKTPKAYNDICRIFIAFYNDALFLKENEKVKYYCLYNLAKATELGYKDTKKEFIFLKVSKHNIKSSKYYFFKTFE